MEKGEPVCLMFPVGVVLEGGMYAHPARGDA